MIRCVRTVVHRDLRWETSCGGRHLKPGGQGWWCYGLINRLLPVLAQARAMTDIVGEGGGDKMRPVQRPTVGDDQEAA